MKLLIVLMMFLVTSPAIGNALLASLSTEALVEMADVIMIGTVGDKLTDDYEMPHEIYVEEVLKGKVDSASFALSPRIKLTIQFYTGNRGVFFLSRVRGQVQLIRFRDRLNYFGSSVTPFEVQDYIDHVKTLIKQKYRTPSNGATLA